MMKILLTIFMKILQNRWWNFMKHAKGFHHCLLLKKYFLNYKTIK